MAAIFLFPSHVGTKRFSLLWNQAITKYELFMLIQQHWKLPSSKFSHQINNVKIRTLAYILSFALALTRTT